ncbi:hypothetical protein OII53_28000 [Achromobacter ruhlandii]|uniref:glycine-rich domain-containing protein n=1 Tax=Achromobacter ruhlandii TaxID=72557 RepID=UPI0021F20E83|nr:hypothetical protein [Achromobacter ruhlandii]MCV6799830.1 hypothetical protein [Achromobacter ruhlandii]MCV6801460.1 hypothetical protein [Achromobacter ruhlandii]MCV6812305.1 hypothetical protein [Achromobacter ruhlandii]MCV6822418.1 hypothetical protein [Achromobacter ruhlandii]
MQASNAPSKSPVPFAESGSKNTIPVASQIGVTPGLASFTDGFPPLTMTPLVAGGIPPKGMDFNGILYFLSSAVRWQQAGGSYTYDSAFATSIGGYPKGAVLLKADLSGFWVNGTENNSTNPDTGGAGWADPMAGRLLNVRVFNTPGTTTYTPTAGTKRIVAHVQGGGGGGGGSEGDVAGTIAAGAGGGSGSYAYFTTTTVPSSITLTVGTGGGGGVWPTNGGIGSAGGSSSIGALVTAPGGLGGNVGRSAVNTSAGPGANGGAGGGAPSGATYGAAGGNGNAGAYINAGTLTGAGANSKYGNGGAMSGSSTAGLFGALPATGYGAGGAGSGRVGSASNGTGGAGSPGIIVIEEYA